MMATILYELILIKINTKLRVTNVKLGPELDNFTFTLKITSLQKGLKMTK